MTAWIGWIATAAFAVSYLARDGRTLRWVQAGAACLWIAYGIALRAAPVVAANVLVAGMALVSARRRSPAPAGETEAFPGQR